MQDLNPCPVPNDLLPLNLQPMTGLECLQQIEPIDDLQHLALHVAQLTMVVLMQQRELQQLKGYDDGR